MLQQRSNGRQVPAQPRAFSWSAAPGTVLLLLLLLRLQLQHCPGGGGHLQQRGNGLGVQQARWVLQQVAVAPWNRGRTLHSPSPSSSDPLHDTLDGERGTPSSGPRSRVLVPAPRLGTQCR